MSEPYGDPLLAALIAVRAAKYSLCEAERVLADEIERQRQAFNRIMDAVRAEAPPTHSLCNVPVEHEPYLDIASSGCCISEDVVDRVDRCGE